MPIAQYIHYESKLLSSLMQRQIRYDHLRFLHGWPGAETKVLYMFSSFGLMGVESRDFSHVKKVITACKED